LNLRRPDAPRAVCIPIARGVMPRAINWSRILRSPRRLTRHHVLDQADDEREDRAGDAAANRLSKYRADIDTACTREHRDQR
jgi:hypothetical protein